jgi:hypothetical protein
MPIFPGHEELSSRWSCKVGSLAYIKSMVTIGPGARMCRSDRWIGALGLPGRVCRPMRKILLTRSLTQPETLIR